VQRGLQVGVVQDPLEPARQVAFLEAHRVVVGEPQPLQPDQRAALVHSQVEGDLGIGGNLLQGDQPAARAQPTASHVLAERGQVRAHRDRRAAHERAGAGHPFHPAVGGQSVQRLSHGHPADLEAGGEILLRRQAEADRQLPGLLTQGVGDRGVFRRRHDEIIPYLPLARVPGLDL
jgi:hypothetical protein